MLKTNRTNIRACEASEKRIQQLLDQRWVFERVDNSNAVIRWPNPINNYINKNADGTLKSVFSNDIHALVFFTRIEEV